MKKLLKIILNRYNNNVLNTITTCPNYNSNSNYNYNSNHNSNYNLNFFIINKTLSKEENKRRWSRSKMRRNFYL